MVQKVRTVKDWWNDNTSYKVVSLFVATILWATMLGRKETIVAKDLQLQFILSEQHEIVNKVRQSVRVEVRGPRVGVKNFSESQSNLAIDLSSFNPGRQVVRISPGALNLSGGVKVLSIYPEEIVVQLKDQSEQK